MTAATMDQIHLATDQTRRLKQETEARDGGS
jgi:hypothetical protein